MPTYIRVELHEKSSYDAPSSSDYTELHDLLGKKNIERYVYNNGQVKYLPTAFYRTESTDKDQIRKDVHAAAKQVGYPYSFVVVPTEAASWYNLEACRR